MANTIRQEDAKKRDSYIVRDINTSDVMTVVFPNGIQTGLEGFDNTRKCTFYNETRHYDGIAVGLTGSDAQIHISSGLSAAGTAPLKFTSGSLMTIPEAGAVEYDGTDIFYTLTTNGQERRNITARPYAAFYSDQNQSNSPGSESIFTYNNTSYSSYIDLIDTTKLQVGYTGIYNLAFSIQFSNADSAEHIASVWLKKDESNLPATKSEVTIHKAQSGREGTGILAANFFVQMSSGSFLQLGWDVDNVNLTAKTIPAGVSPDSPISPSIVVTLSRID